MFRNRPSSIGLTLASAVALATPHLAVAQRYNNTAASGGIFACCSGAAIGIPIAIIALNIALLVWVAKDAKSRGMENSILWMLLVLFTSFIGLIIYILSRPKGAFVPCPRCGEKKLPMLVKCPHCGASV